MKTTTIVLPESVLLPFRWLPQYSVINLLIGIGILVCAKWLIHHLLWSPISKVPGPWYTNVSSFSIVYHYFYGTKRIWIHNLHLKYGPVVRLAPNEVSFTSASALREIYVAAGGYVKTDFYDLFKQDGHRNIFTTLDKKEHNEMKRRFADRYSNTAILQTDLQALLRERAEMFAQICAKEKAADIYLYLHCYSFDCINEMVFHPHGTKSLECVADTEIVKQLSYKHERSGMVIRHYFPMLERLYKWYTQQVVEQQEPIFEYVTSALRKVPHSSFTLATRLLEYPDMSEASMVAECLDHLAAGIETTGDALCFLMWELSQPRNAMKMQRLCKELQTCDPVDARKLDSLPYLNAMIEEAIRLWTPAPLPLPRYVPQGGRHIDGYYIPGAVIVSAPPYTVHRLEEDLFPEPDTFSPERWFEEKGSIERQRLMTGFGVGARACIGKFLAISEMKLLLHAVYSKYRTRPAKAMHASMELSDQIITSRPKDMLCKLIFEAIE